MAKAHALAQPAPDWEKKFYQALAVVTGAGRKNTFVWSRHSSRMVM